MARGSGREVRIPDRPGLILLSCRRRWLLLGSLRSLLLGLFVEFGCTGRAAYCLAHDLKPGAARHSDRLFSVSTGGYLFLSRGILPRAGFKGDPVLFGMGFYHLSAEFAIIHIVWLAILFRLSRIDSTELTLLKKLRIKSKLKQHSKNRINVHDTFSGI